MSQIEGHGDNDMCTMMLVLLTLVITGLSNFIITTRQILQPLSSCNHLVPRLHLIQKHNVDEAELTAKTKLQKLSLSCMQGTYLQYLMADLQLQNHQADILS